MAKKSILFIPKETRPGTEKFFCDYKDPEKYGISVCSLTPRHDRNGYGFAVRSNGRRYRGYISSKGDLIVRLAHAANLQPCVQ